jgi:hypothetical protein
MIVEDEYGNISNIPEPTYIVCEECGSKEVEFKGWIDANTNTPTGCEAPEEEIDCWCRCCKKNVKLIANKEKLNND